MNENIDLCKVGDTVYRVTKQGVIVTTVEQIDHYPHAVYRLKHCPESYFNRAFGRTVFLTMEDANNAIHMKDNIVEKRKLLKEYERELNEKLGITDHFIIK